MRKKRELSEYWKIFWTFLFIAAFILAILAVSSGLLELFGKSSVGFLQSIL